MSSIAGALYRPHCKEYCIHYQTKLGTLKGIHNTWAEVPQNGSCAWENQQHGRGHHVKVVLSQLKPGTVINLTLVHEDGTKAPAFTVTKNGGQKSTMLIGVDPRDWRDGLSWTNKNQEGPRKWHPAANFVIMVTEAGSENHCMKDGKNDFVYLVPCDQPVVIPIRIEVLSAVKGAGNFSRYCVQCTTKPIDSNWQLPIPKITCKAPGANSSWKSPPILIEAKWLPAAPVREQNKKRFNKASNGNSRQGRAGVSKSSGDRIDHRKGELNGRNTLVDAISYVKAATANLEQKKERLSTRGSALRSNNDNNDIDSEIEQLEHAIHQYKMRRAMNTNALNRTCIGNSLEQHVSNERMVLMEQMYKNEKTRKTDPVSSPPRSPALNSIAQTTINNSMQGMFDRFNMLASAASDFSRLATVDSFDGTKSAFSTNQRESAPRSMVSSQNPFMHYQHPFEINGYGSIHQSVPQQVNFNLNMVQPSPPLKIVKQESKDSSADGTKSRNLMKSPPLQACSKRVRTDSWSQSNLKLSAIQS